MKRIIALLMAVVMIFSLTACSGKKNDADTDDDKGDVSVGDGENGQLADSSVNDGNTENNEDGDNKSEDNKGESVKDEPKIDVKTFEGVYSGEKGKVAIRDCEDDALEFIIDISTSEGKGYLAAYAMIDGTEAYYNDGALFLTIKFSDGTIAVEESGTNRYAQGVSFSGTFSLTSEDPYTIEAIRSQAPVDDNPEIERNLPDTFEATVVNGDPALVYTGNGGEYYVTMPDVFTALSEEYQPDDGVAVTAGDQAHLTVEYLPGSAQTAQEAAEYLKSRYGGEAVIDEEGQVRFIYTYEDGEGDQWGEFICMQNDGNNTVKVNYVFSAENYSYWYGLADIISISMS